MGLEILKFLFVSISYVGAVQCTVQEKKFIRCPLRELHVPYKDVHLKKNVVFRFGFQEEHYASI